MKKTTANSAYSAAEAQRKTGKLPDYSPKERTHQSKGSAIAAKEAALSLIKNPRQDIPSLKHSLSLKHKVPFLRNSEILANIPAIPRNAALRRMLVKSPTRTLSGVSPIALMPPPIACPGKCIYCPKGENAPQSYTGYEPTTMRAIQCGYSAEKQVEARLEQYASQGHRTDKCHLIIMGGTFLCSPLPHQQKFMLSAYNALNGKKSKSLESAIAANESAAHRAIGVTFETRPDFGLQKHADAMLSMGGTQVELGVQTLSDAVYRRVLRGHTVSDVVRSTAILRDSGFKIGYHMMPGLFATQKEDIGYFKKLFASQDFQPDMVKIYPVLVMQGTQLYSMWKRGKFSPYTTDEAAEVIASATRFIPPYVRIPRIQRDIPSPLIAAGVKNSNLRQIVDRLLEERGERCRCIRCREIGSGERRGVKQGKLRLELSRIEYSSAGGKEIFLSFEDKGQDLLAGFLRLRIPHSPHRQELINSSIVRELHIYGQEAAIGERDSQKQQHKGLGEKLLREAEEITGSEFGLGKISVLSGAGARGYYRKFGYALDGAYMSKGI